MTFVTAVLGSLIRAVVVTAFVLTVSRRWSQRLNHTDPRWRGMLWAIILAPGLVPELLLGYAYAPWVTGRPVLAEILCAGLLALRLLPVGVIAWQLTPPSPLSRSAWHVRRMTLRDDRRMMELLRCWWVGPIRSTIPAAALVGLQAFQEFELAALLKAVSWTDWLFVDQIGGRAFGDLVRAAAIPALLQIGVISGAVWCLRPKYGSPTSTSIDDDSGVPRPCRPCEVAERAAPAHGRGTLRFDHFTTPWLWGIIAWGLILIVPLSSLVWGLPNGFVQLAGQSLRWQGLLRELLGNVAVSVTAACAAWLLAGGVPPVIDRGLRQGWTILIGVVCLPGLSGALVLSLGILTLFQRSLLSGLYDTPLMWVLASTLFLLPRAVLLRLWLHQADGSAVTIAHNLCESNDRSQRRAGWVLVWRVRDEPRFFAVCCLAYSSYLELTLAALLAPTGLPSGLVRLYNFLHFGRTAALSAEMTVLLGIPLLFAALMWGLARKGRV